ncbi:MAG: hypothetical protein JW969_17725 [Spirochaetales bacterium]|nr:hypothetical protein [Spirochaetales bacterium]
MNYNWTEVAVKPMTILPDTMYHLKITAKDTNIYIYEDDMDTPVLMRRDAYAWIKETGSPIPVTSTCEKYDGGSYSDFFSWHQYDGYSGAEAGRAALCTECMNRNSQTVPGIVNYFTGGTGYIMWEFGIGRDNCRFPWNSPEGTAEPVAPFHGVVYPDGHPWSIADVQEVAGNDLSSAPLFNVEYSVDNFTSIVKTSITPLIDFDLGDEIGTGSPDASAGIPVGNFSIRWTGRR